MGFLIDHWETIGAVAGAGYGWWQRRKHARAAAAEAARKAEMDRLVGKIERGEGDIAELLAYVKTLDPLWRPTKATKATK